MVTYFRPSQVIKNLLKCVIGNSLDAAFALQIGCSLFKGLTEL